MTRNLNVDGGLFHFCDRPRVLLLSLNERDLPFT